MELDDSASAASDWSSLWHVFFVKAHTRPWYDWSPLEAAGLAVRLEASAYRLLDEAGLATPDVVAAHSTAGNPLAWPCLITRQMRGEPLPVAAAAAAGDAALRAAGAYLRKMHDVMLAFPGYLIDGAPAEPPTPGSYHHPNWTIESFLAAAFGTWSSDREVDAAAVEDIANLLLEVSPRLRLAFCPPRLITNDCYAGQLFVEATGQDAEVTGVIDMEVASSGTPLADLFKVFVELGGASPRPRWWEPFLAGYGPGVDFDAFRLYMLAQDHGNYTAYGDRSWPGSRPQILNHILRSTTWSELVDLARIPEQSPV